MALDQTIDATRSRRALLAAATGGALAAIAAALGRPLPTRAAHAGTLQLEHDNGPTAAQTSVFTSADFTTAFRGASDGTGGFGLNGESASGTGVYGNSDSGDGVHGQTVSGIGVSAVSTDGRAIFAHSDSSTGVHGESEFDTGVMGFAGTPPAPASLPKTGVYGYAIQDASARGVLGRTTLGRGVEGQATSGFGMFARATTGQGIQASATTGTGIYAYADTNGTALRTTRGHVRFSTAGLATIAAGTSSITVTPGFDINASSKVLAVLQGNAGGASVRHVVRDTGNDRFTIQLTANATAATPVAWFVIS